MRMSTRIVPLLLLPLLVATTFAHAGPSSDAAETGLAAAFDNTIVSTYPDGREAKLWLNPDGTYTGEGRKRTFSSGHWKIRGDNICMTQSEPLAIPFSYCTPLQEGGVGTTWEAKAISGETVVCTLVHGRPPEYGSQQTRVSSWR